MEWIKRAKSAYIAVSVIMVILGAVLMLNPGLSMLTLCYLIGGLMVIFGITRLVGYFSKDLYRLAFQYDLTSGVLLIALGTVMLVHPGSLMTFICIVLGIFVLADGMFKIQISFEAKSFGIPEWWLILIFAVVTGICGLLLAIRPGDGGRVLTVILGITLLAEGMLNFSTVITAVKIIKHQRPDVIEADFYEERKD